MRRNAEDYDRNTLYLHLAVSKRGWSILICFHLGSNQINTSLLGSHQTATIKVRMNEGTATIDTSIETYKTASNPLVWLLNDSGSDLVLKVSFDKRLARSQDDVTLLHSYSYECMNEGMLRSW